MSSWWSRRQFIDKLPAITVKVYVNNNTADKKQLPTVKEELLSQPVCKQEHTQKTVCTEHNLMYQVKTFQMKVWYLLRSHLA